MSSKDFRVRAKRYAIRIVPFLIVIPFIIMIACFYWKWYALLIALFLTLMLWLIYSVRHVKKIMRETGLSSEEKKLKDKFNRT